MTRGKILRLLEGGDRRSIGRADQVVALVSQDPRLFPQLIAGLWSTDSLVRMRAADAAEKATRASPRLLRPYKKELLGIMAETQEPELRWHLAQIVPRLALNPAQRRLVVTFLNGYLQDRHSLVRTSGLQGLADLAQGDPALRAAVIEILRESTRSGTPAMKARSRILLLELESPRR